MAERLVTDTLVNGQEKYLPLTADQYRQRFNAIAELPDLNEQVRFQCPLGGINSPPLSTPVCGC